MTPRTFITAACASLEIALPEIPNSGLHLDLNVLLWSKVVEFWGPQSETKNKTPKWAFAHHLRTATASHRKLQPAKLRDAPDGVREGVGCARRRSYAARNDSRGAFVCSNLRASRSTKNPLKR